MDKPVKLKEERHKVKEHFFVYQNCVKFWIDRKYLGEKRFDLGDLVLKWDRTHEDKGKHTKFQPLWIGPSIVNENLNHNSFKLKSLDWRKDPFP